MTTTNLRAVIAALTRLDACGQLATVCRVLSVAMENDDNLWDVVAKDGEDGERALGDLSDALKAIGNTAI